MLVIVNDDGSIDKLARLTDSQEALAMTKKYLNEYGEDWESTRNVEMEIFSVDFDNKEVDIQTTYPDGTVGGINLECHSDGYKWIPRT